MCIENSMLEPVTIRRFNMPRDNDVKVVVWTGRGCGACTNAKHLLGRKGIRFTERRLKHDPATQRSFARATGGARTVPQIFVGERCIGGFDDLLQIDKSGELDVLLGRADGMPQRSRWQRFVQWMGW